MCMCMCVIKIIRMKRKERKVMAYLNLLETPHSEQEEVIQIFVGFCRKTCAYQHMDKVDIYFYLLHISKY